MKILITGGAGFIGSHLAEKLLGLGHEVFIIDNLWTGRLSNIKKIQDHKKAVRILSPKSKKTPTPDQKVMRSEDESLHLMVGWAMPTRIEIPSPARQ